jgi:hypothetical protein
MAFSYNKKNLANTTITGAITPTQTSVTVADATVFSYAFFYATLMPSNEMSNASNSEIVLVTNIQGNTLTLVRGQENTIARSFPYGAVITNGIYTRDIDYARSIGRKVFMAEDDGTDNANTSYQITDPMIKNVPEEGSIITVEFDKPSYGAPTLGVNNGIGGLVQVSGKNIHITDSSGQVDSVGLYGDTEQQTYSGKNLAKTTDCNISGTGYTMQITNGYVEISTQSNNSAFDICGGTRFGAWLPTYSSAPDYHLTGADGGTYVLKCFDATGTSITGTKNNTLRICTNQRQVDGIIWSSGYYDTLTITLNQDEYIKDIAVWTNGDNSSVILKFKPQLEKGSTATSYEPYVGGTASPNPDYPQEVQTVTGRQVVTITDGDSQSQEYEINLGKNLYEGSPSFDSFSGISAWEDGGTYNGMPVIKRAAAWSGAYRLININAGVTYTFSSWVKSDEASQVAIYAIGSGATATISPTNKTITTSTSWERVSFTFTCSTSGTIALRFENTSASTTNYTYISGYQLELGSTATTYAPYFTPIELCKIGDYQDYIYKSGEDWYVHKEMGKSVISSDNVIFTLATYTNVQYAIFPKQSDDVAYGTYPNIQTLVYSAATFKATSNWDSANMIGAISGAAAGSYYWVGFPAGTTLADAKAKLNGSVLYYALATPTDTKITDENLIAQLNALYNMLPEGVADVVVTGDLAGSLTIKYYQQGTGTYTAPIVGGAEIDGGDNEQVVELDSYLPYRLVYDTNGYWRVLNKGPKVTTGAIADGSITTAKLDDGAVTNAKLANGAVNVSKIEDGSVSNSKIANGAVNVAKIEDGAVSTAKIANGAVSNGKIANGAVDTNKLANGAVSAVKINWSGIFNRTTKTVTLDSTGNASLNIKTSEYWVLAVNQIGSGNYVNGNIVPYTWQDGKYYIHVDKNYDHAYSTGNIQVEILTIKRSVIGF